MKKGKMIFLMILTSLSVQQMNASQIYSNKQNN